jgi:hypothetical protein
VQEYNESTTVTLTAHPSIGSTFTGFSGDCQVGEARAAAAVVDVTCRVAVNGVKSVAAGFTPTSGGGGGGGGGGGPVGGSGGTPPPGGGGSGGTVTPLVSPTLALSERHRRSITVSLDPGTLASNVILTCGLRVGGHRVGHVKRLTQGLGAGTPATVSIRISPALRQRIRAAHKAGKKARLKLKAVFYAADGTITVRRLTIRR